MCDKDATVGNIEYIVSFFFSIKKSPHDISLKNHSLIDSTVSNVQKKFTKQFFTGHIQVFKKTIKKLYRMGSNLFHIFFFVFAINYLYEKTWFWMCCIFFFVFNSEIVFLFYLFFSNSDIDTIHDFCFHQYYNIKLGSSLISHMFIYQTNTQWAQSLFEIIFE